MPVRGIPSDYIPVVTLIFSRALHATPTIRDPGTGYKAISQISMRQNWSIGKLSTYPSPKPTFSPQWEVSVNVGLRER